MRGTRRCAMRRRSSTQVITAMASKNTPLQSRAMPAYSPVMLGPVPLDFIFFALVLLGIALFHHHTLQVAVTGLVVVTIYKVVFTGFPQGAGMAGLIGLFAHEWVILVNLFGL